MAFLLQPDEKKDEDDEIVLEVADNVVEESEYNKEMNLFVVAVVEEEDYDLDLKEQAEDLSHLDRRIQHRKVFYLAVVRLPLILLVGEMRLAKEQRVKVAIDVCSQDILQLHHCAHHVLQIGVHIHPHLRHVQQFGRAHNLLHIPVFVAMAVGQVD